LRARTSKAKIGQQARVSQFMTMRLGGMSLADIGDKQEPKITAQAVHKTLKAALSGVMTETAEQARTLEALRLDQLLGAIWEQCMAGDVACIDRAVQIKRRRSQLLGLDLQRPSLFYGHEDGDADPATVRVEIVGNPNVEKLKFLERERERLIALTEGSAPPSTTIN
jgi:hypothetical protein